MESATQQQEQHTRKSATVAFFKKTQPNPEPTISGAQNKDRWHTKMDNKKQ